MIKDGKCSKSRKFWVTTPLIKMIGGFVFQNFKGGLFVFIPYILSPSLEANSKSLLPSRQRLQLICASPEFIPKQQYFLLTKKT